MSTIRFTTLLRKSNIASPELQFLHCGRRPFFHLHTHSPIQSSQVIIFDSLFTLSAWDHRIRIISITSLKSFEISPELLQVPYHHHVCQVELTEKSSCPPPPLRFHVCLQITNSHFNRFPRNRVVKFANHPERNADSIVLTRALHALHASASAAVYCWAVDDGKQPGQTLLLLLGPFNGRRRQILILHILVVLVQHRTCSRPGQTQWVH